MNREEYLSCYTQMLRIRMVENEIANNYYNEIREMHTPIHLYNGQEAVAVGVCHLLRKDDTIFSNHRSHGHYLAKGGDLKRMIAELFAKEEGCCHGKGGSMHLMDRDAGVALSSSIVAGNVSIGTGFAFANKLQNKNAVSVVFLGDGASEEGSVYESICFAELKKIPVVFVCENNMYAISTPLEKREPLNNIASKFSAIIDTYEVDGNDILEVDNVAKTAIDRARNLNKPAFIECHTYRTRDHHNIGNGVEPRYRTMDQLEKWEKNCPIRKAEEYMQEKEWITGSEIEEIKKNINAEIEEAFVFAHKGKLPDREQLEKGVWSKS